jgi:hypothetical protein
MIGFGAGVARLVVAAVLKMPVGPKLWAADGLAQISGDDLPGGMPMPFHEVSSDLIGNALIAQLGHQLGHGLTHAFEFEPRASVCDEPAGPGDLADVQDQPLSMVYRGIFDTRRPGARLRWSDGSHQIIDTSLRCTSLSPSM